LLLSEYKVLRLIIARHLGGVNGNKKIFLDFRPNECSVGNGLTARILVVSGYIISYSCPSLVQKKGGALVSLRLLSQAFYPLFCKPSIKILATSGRVNSGGGVFLLRSISLTFVPESVR